MTPSTAFFKPFSAEKPILNPPYSSTKLGFEAIFSHPSLKVPRGNF